MHVGGGAGCRTEGEGINQEVVGKLKWGGGGGRGWAGLARHHWTVKDFLSLFIPPPLAPIGVLSSSSTPAETQTAREREKGGKSAGGISAEHQRPKRLGVGRRVGWGGG